MISAKLFNTEEELQRIEEKFEKLGVNVHLCFESMFVCEVNDHITNESVCLVASLKQSSYELKGYFLTEEKDYLIDCGIRMILNYLYNLGNETATFLFDCEEEVLEKSCKKIGLKHLNNVGNMVQYSLEAAVFYSSMC